MGTGRREIAGLAEVIEEASRVSEAMLPFKVFGFGAAVPWVWGNIPFPSSRPHGAALHSAPFPLHLGFLTVEPVSTRDWFGVFLILVNSVFLL